MEIEVVEAKITKNRVKQALKKARLSQEEGARRVGVSYRHFNRVTLMHTEPSLIEAAKMALVLGTTIDKLFTIRIDTRKARAGSS